NWHEAINALDKAIEIAVHFNQGKLEATGRQTKAELLLDLGRYDEAEELTNRCRVLAERDSDKLIESYSLRILGGIHLGRGRIDLAVDALKQALRLSTSLRDVTGIVLADILLAECNIQDKAIEQADEYVESAHGRLKEEKSKSLILSGMIQRVHGRVQAAAGDYVEAKNHLSQSLSVFATTAIPYELARSHEAMGLLLRDLGDIKGAKSHLTDAFEIFKLLGAAPGSERTQAVLNSIRSDSQGVQSHPSLHGVTYVPGETSTGQSSSDAQTAGALAIQNDVALMQRLIEASGSRDLLLQELAAVVYECLSVEVVMVCRYGESGTAQLIASEGITVPQAERLCSELNCSFERSDGARDGASIVHINSAIDRPDRQTEAAPLFLYIKPASQVSVKRLQPLIKQVELGLETCLLRASSTAAGSLTAARTAKVVMPGFIVGSPLMFDVLDKIHKIRTSDVTVLITGESGTGKELVARAIHAESARARAIFLPFNCTATPRDLIESQLFGHRRGAFTGAVGNYPGMVRAAEGGTLFLDEIGDLALEVQPKLMRFLQESEIQPLGETKPQRVDVRVLAATNSDLERAVEEGRFREDLFHRLNIIRIHVPPLRERREEVPVLASFFLEHFASRSGNNGLALSQDGLAALSAHDWPGNIRQLRNEIERATAYASGNAVITASDLSPEVRASAGRRRQPDGIRRQDRSTDGRQNGHFREVGSLPGVSGAAEARPGPIKLKEAVAAVEQRLILEALGRNKNNLSQTAIELGLSRRGLRMKLAQFGIERG
ncbi:MAG TPA: sigma 54-interacting transcriptional regulator, partial [Blastocatellia bacterium]